MAGIILNRIETPDGTVLTSWHRHDYQQHVDSLTGHTYVIDGGRDYLKRMGPPDYKELSVLDNAPFEDIRKAFYRFTDNKYSRTSDSISISEPKGYMVPLCSMSDEWLNNVIRYNQSVKPAPSFQYYDKELEYRKHTNTNNKA